MHVPTCRQNSATAVPTTAEASEEEDDGAGDYLFVESLSLPLTNSVVDLASFEVGKGVHVRFLLLNHFLGVKKSRAPKDERYT